MNRCIIVACSLLIGLGLVSMSFAAQRVVVCEEWYQES
jgi:hypothetical protein